MNLAFQDRVLWRLRHMVVQRPGVKPKTSPEDPIYVAGLFRTASGIGQSARSCADALEGLGATVIRIDLSEGFGQVDLENDFPGDSSARQKGGTLIVHLNGPEFERALFLSRTWRGTGRRIIASWVWELPLPPLSWRSTVNLFDELWVPSEFTKQAMLPICAKPIRVVPYFIEKPVVSAVRPEGQLGLRCLVMSDGQSSFDRKNVIGAITAFRKASLPPGSHLVVKTRNISAYPELGRIVMEKAAQDRRITLVNESMPRAEVRDLMNNCDVLISLHRAEGFGLPMAEAMMLGKVVVATGWSANLDFMDSGSAVLVPAKMVPVFDRCGVYQSLRGAEWAEPDVEFAANALSELAGDAALRDRIGRTAIGRVAHLATGRQYAEALGWARAR